MASTLISMAEPNAFLTSESNSYSLSKSRAPILNLSTENPSSIFCWTLVFILSIEPIQINPFIGIAALPSEN